MSDSTNNVHRQAEVVAPSNNIIAMGEDPSKEADKDYNTLPSKRRSKRTLCPTDRYNPNAYLPGSSSNEDAADRSVASFLDDDISDTAEEGKDTQKHNDDDPAVSTADSRKGDDAVTVVGLGPAARPKPMDCFLSESSPPHTPISKKRRTAVENTGWGASVVAPSLVSPVNTNKSHRNNSLGTAGNHGSVNSSRPKTVAVSSGTAASIVSPNSQRQSRSDQQPLSLGWGRSTAEATSSRKEEESASANDCATHPSCPPESDRETHPAGNNSKTVGDWGSSSKTQIRTTTTGWGVGVSANHISEPPPTRGWGVADPNGSPHENTSEPPNANTSWTSSQVPAASNTKESTQKTSSGWGKADAVNRKDYSKTSNTIAVGWGATNSSSQNESNEARNTNSGWGAGDAVNPKDYSKRSTTIAVGWGATNSSLNEESNEARTSPNMTSGWGSAALPRQKQNMSMSMNDSNKHAPTGWKSESSNELRQHSETVPIGWHDASSDRLPEAPSAPATTSRKSPRQHQAPVKRLCSPQLEFRQMSKTPAKRLASKRFVKSEFPVEVIRQTGDDFFLRWLFENRVKIFEVGMTEYETLPKTRQIGRQEYTLVASKDEREKRQPSKFSASKFGGSGYIKSYYVKGDAKDIQKELDQVANWSELAIRPGKLASRLELLVSTAARSNMADRRPFMFLLPKDDVEEIDAPDNHTMGCGFIPSRILEELLGHGTDAKEAIAVQCRVICPTLGIFKGMLVRKHGINKIQLPNSMKKVPKATTTSCTKSFDGAFLLLNNVAPSIECKMLERSLNPTSKRVPTKSSKEELRDIPVMVSNVLQHSGIPIDAIEAYNYDARQGFDCRYHASLIGVSDCTGGGLPEGTVFITGSGGTIDSVFVTRSPCTEKNDGKILKVISEQPKGLPDSAWAHLCSLSFGAIIFSSPKDTSAVSLPESINDSDLDGDRFFCLWEPSLLNIIRENQNTKEICDELPYEYDCDADEEVLGMLVPFEIDGETYYGRVVRKAEDGANYVAEFRDHTKILSYEELTKDIYVAVEVLDHQGTGRHARVKVHWSCGECSWHSFLSMKAQIPRFMADYACKSNLCEEPGWRWTKDYLREAEIVSIQNHRCRKGVSQVEVLYDGDPETVWIDAEEVDEEMLVLYLESKSVSMNDKRWRWLKQRVSQIKNDWFARVQDRVANVKHMAEYSRFIESLHRQYKKTSVSLSDSKDCIWYGRAYKKSLQIGKHGGRVPLPAHLRTEIESSKTYHFEKFLMDAA